MHYVGVCTLYLFILKWKRLNDVDLILDDLTHVSTFQFDKDVLEVIRSCCHSNKYFYK